MKKGLLMVIVLLSMASFMAAMAYSSATITNAAKLKVVNTNDALLALENTASWSSTVGFKDKTVKIVNGELFFQFGNGVNNSGGEQFHGLQPNSTYEWNYLFTVKNKSAETINVKISLDGPLAQYITLGVTRGEGTGAYWIGKSAPLELNNITSNGLKNIALKIDMPQNSSFTASEILGSIIVEANAR